MSTTPATRSPLSVRRPWLIALLAVVGFVVAGALGGDVQDSLVSGGFDDPGSESSAAAAVVADTFDGGAPDVVLLVTAADGSVDAPEVAAAGVALTEDMASRGEVVQATSYWTLGSAPPLRSTDGDRALVLLRFAGDESERLDRAGELREELHERDLDGVAEVTVGGMSAVFSEVNETVESDLVLAEVVALPLTLIRLIIIFGSVVSAMLPLAIGGLSIVGTFLALELIAGLTDVSIFALNFTTALGLGLAIDYALLVVNRYREELAAGHDPTTAVTRTVRTAGRTVVFSGLTVASSLVALLVFQFAFLKSFAYAGIAVVGLAVVGAVVVLPAILVLLGHRVNALTVRRPKVTAPGEETDGVWHRIAMTVMRRPVPIATVSTLVLLLLGVPFLGVELGFPDDRVLPPGAETRAVSEVLRTEFDSREQSALSVVVPDVDARGTDAAAISGYAQQLSTLDGVARVDAAVGSFIGGVRLPVELPFAATLATSDATYLQVVPDVEPISAAGEQLVADVRAVDAPADGVLVGGPSAELADSKQGLVDRLPLALALIAVITFVVLFLSFGSVLMPVKAIVLNLLSLTATLGAMVWVFQDGRFQDALGFTATGSLTVTMPILLFVLAFGLSMDYEVFLLSRIKEEWDRTGDPIGSVAQGLERTGRIVTAAAVLIAVVFVSFGITGSVSFMKLFGFGMTLAVLVDAFVVRTTLVPAFMRLAGGANWWAPAPLRRFHDRFGFSEHVDLDDDEIVLDPPRQPMDAIL